MKNCFSKQYIRQALLLMALAISSGRLHAQLYIGPDFTLYVEPGSELFIDSLVLKPNVQMALSDLNVSKSYTAESTSSGPTIKRIYTITAPIDFSGDLGIYYGSNELNGSMATSLSIAYENVVGSGFVAGTGGTVTPADNYVTLPLSTTTTLARVTAIGSGVALPVSLISFEAKAMGNRTLLSWETANEQQCDHYEISRSGDAVTFTSLGLIKSKGNTAQQQQYTLQDQAPLKGNNYYRLMQYDVNGKVSILGTRLVRFGEPNTPLVITTYPNPVVDALHISLSEPSTGAATILLSNVNGSTISQQSVNNMHQEVSMKYLAKGVYFIRYSDSRTIRTFKVEKL